MNKTNKPPQNILVYVVTFLFYVILNVVSLVCDLLSFAMPHFLKLIFWIIGVLCSAYVMQQSLSAVSIEKVNLLGYDKTKPLYVTYGTGLAIVTKINFNDNTFELDGLNGKSIPVTVSGDNIMPAYKVCRACHHGYYVDHELK